MGSEKRTEERTSVQFDEQTEGERERKSQRMMKAAQLSNIHRRGVRRCVVVCGGGVVGCGGVWRWC